MRRFTQTICTLSLAAIVVLAAVTVAPAQQRLGTGRGLESNLQRGGNNENRSFRGRTSAYGNALGNGRLLQRDLSITGRYRFDHVRNRPGSYQDALVTGNTAGLSRFRGQIDYGAVGEFRGQVGGSEVFDFSARAYQPSGSGYNFGRTPQFRQRTGGNVLLRPGSAVTAGQITGQLTPYGPRNNPARLDSTGLTATQRRGALDAELDPIRPYGRQTLAVRADAEGRLLQVEASPLTGLTMRQLPERRSGIAAPQVTDGPRVPQGLTNPNRISSEPWRGGPAAGATRLTADALGRERPEEAEAEAGARELDLELEPGDAYRQLLDQIRDQTGADLQQAQPADEDREAEDATGRPRQQMFENLDYELPRIQTFAGQADSLFNNAIKRAESHMRSGEYFRAESAFNEALHYKRGHPLAMVGQVHAQIGAGLYRTAGRGLRSLLSAHPELAAARYEFPILPSQERINAVTTQLQDMSDDAADDTTAPLLLAYLAYQAEQPGMVEQHLQTFQDRAPRDPVGRLLDRVWLGQPKAADQPENPVEE